MVTMPIEIADIVSQASYVYMITLNMTTPTERVKVRGEIDRELKVLRIGRVEHRVGELEDEGIAYRIGNRQTSHVSLSSGSSARREGMPRHGRGGNDGRCSVDRKQRCARRLNPSPGTAAVPLARLPWLSLSLARSLAKLERFV
jgi:hypothetical protein